MPQLNQQMKQLWKIMCNAKQVEISEWCQSSVKQMKSKSDQITTLTISPPFGSFFYPDGWV